MPSQPQVATLLGSMGCHLTSMQTPSWTLRVRRFLHDFQFQTQSLPSPSPEARNYPSGEKSIPQAYPALVCPANFFFRFSLKEPLQS